MSDTTGVDPTGTDAAAGGTPSESDLPAMQGLGESADDPSDPTAPRQQAPTGSGDAAGLAGAVGDDDEGPSDPMPDMAGTS
jgi:hypothetical protein